VLPRFVSIQAGVEKGGKGVGDATPMRNCTSGGNSAQGTRVESADGSDKYVGIAWAGVDWQRAMCHRRLHAAATAAPHRSGAGVGMYSNMLRCTVGDENNSLWCVFCSFMLVLLLVCWHSILLFARILWSS